jgi:hypothetical protein
MRQEYTARYKDVQGQKWGLKLTWESCLSITTKPSDCYITVTDYLLFPSIFRHNFHPGFVRIIAVSPITNSNQTIIHHGYFPALPCHSCCSEQLTQELFKFTTSTSTLHFVWEKLADTFRLHSP